MNKRAGNLQSPRDRILWVLTSNEGRMGRSKLRARVGIEYVLLDPILAELVEEGRIIIEAGNMIRLV